VGVDRVDRSDVAAQFCVDELTWCSSERWAADLDPARRPDIVVEAVGHQSSALQHGLSAVAVSGTVLYCRGGRRVSRSGSQFPQ
jgi:hypothetical protein